MARGFRNIFYLLVGVARQFDGNQVASRERLVAEIAAATNPFFGKRQAGDLEALHPLYLEGDQLRRQRPFGGPHAEALAWEARVQAVLNEKVPKEALSFEHCPDRKIGLKRLETKLTKLRMIIQRLHQ